MAESRTRSDGDHRHRPPHLAGVGRLGDGADQPGYRHDRQPDSHIHEPKTFLQAIEDMRYGPDRGASSRGGRVMLPIYHRVGRVRSGKKEASILHGVIKYRKSPQTHVIDL